MFDILRYPFMQNALLAGGFVALIAPLIGYFLIIRGLTFAGHALPNIGFAGAAGAVLLQVDPVFGLFAFTISAGVGIALLGKQVRERDISIGILMTFALGLGLMFLSLYSGYAQRVYSILFGTILGISYADVLITALVSILILLLMLILFRPLLFSSLDPALALARGVPVQFLSVIFLTLVAITISVAIQVIGALLVFVLLIGPAATAIRLAHRPLWTILIATALSISYTVLGIVLAGLNGFWPVSFYIATISFCVYLPVRLLTGWRSKNYRRGPSSLQPDQAESSLDQAAVQTASHIHGTTH